MITVFVKGGLLGTGSAIEFQVPWREDLRVRDIRLGCGHVLPMAEVGVAINGELLPDDALVPDGCMMLMACAPGYVLVPFVIQALVTAVVSIGISYLIQSLTPKPQPPGLPQERGAEQSAAYSWSGVQTNFGQGLTVPVVGGRHVVGGQYIYTSVTIDNAQNSELLTALLVLSEGPVYRIGDQEARVANALGTGGSPYPDNIKINGNRLVPSVPSAKVWLRPGSLDQPAMPADAFAGAKTVFFVNGELNTNAGFPGPEQVFTYSGTNAVAAIEFIMHFPAGLYANNPNGTQSGLAWAYIVQWREVGVTTWNAFYDDIGQVINPWQVQTSAAPPRLGPFSEYLRARVNSNGDPVVGPLEIRVVALYGGTVPGRVQNNSWRSMTVQFANSFAYPGCALLGFQLVATGRVSGSLPQVQTRVDGVLVRLWDETHGFSEPLWERPTSGSFAFVAAQGVPGRNPSWFLCEFLTSRWGLGAYFPDARIDWPAFRRWAAFCDTIPTGWNEPGFQVGMVLDQAKSAWDQVLAIYSAGRAAPVWRNGKLSVVYQYRDSHGDLGITVPARTAVQLITSGLCEEVQLRFLQKGGRPTAFQFQFLNEESDFVQDVLTVEDNESAINDPTDPRREEWIPEVVQSYSVTRPSQHVREGYYMHRVNRLVRAELSFTCGPWMLAAEVGQVIDFESDVLRPFDDDVPMAMQVVAGGEAVLELTVDHAVSGTGLGFALREEDGVPVLRNIDLVTPTTYRGRPATIIAFTGALDVAAGSSIAIGKIGKITQPYQVIAITLQKDLRRSVRCFNWDPAVFDPVPVDAGTDAAPENILSQLPADAYQAPTATAIQVIPLQDGKHLVTWGRVDTARAAAKARVYMRAKDLFAWFLLGETVDAELEVRGLVVGREYVIAVTYENNQGDFPPPELGGVATFVPEEFPPWAFPAPTNLAAVQSAGENVLLLSWDLADRAQFDYFEVRCGEDWTSAETVYRGKMASVRLQPPRGFETYQVAARSTSGLYGLRKKIGVTLSAVPYPGAVQEDLTSHAPTGSGGTHDQTELDAATEPSAPFIALVSGALSGTFTSDEVDLGYTAPFFVRVAISRQEMDGTTVDEWTFAVDSGEALWRTVDARPASVGYPGIDWSTKVDDLTMPVDDLPPEFTVNGTIGEVGSHTRCHVESRFYVDGAWGEWSTHVDRLVRCERWQARLRFGRTSTRHSIRARTFTMETMI